MVPPDTALNIFLSEVIDFQVFKQYLRAPAVPTVLTSVDATAVLSLVLATGTSWGVV